MTARRLALLALLLLALLAGMARLVLDNGQEPVEPRVPDEPPAVVDEPRASGPIGMPSRTRRRRAQRHPGQADPVVDVETPAADAPVESEPAVETRRLEVVVLGPGDIPVTGVVVHDRSEAGRPRHVTDGEGIAVFDGPLEGSHPVECPLIQPGSIELTAERTELRISDLLPLDLRFVDLETGEPVAALVSTDGPLDNEGEWFEERHEVTVPHAPLRPGSGVDLVLHVEAPNGYAEPAPGRDGPIIRRGSISLGGGAGGGFRSRLHKRIQTHSGSATLRVRVLRRDGRPASNALVQVKGARSRSERADARGVAAFNGMPPGAYVVRATEPGLVTTTAEVELADGETLAIDIEESEGTGATIVVVDADGVLLPFAAVTAHVLSNPTHAELRGGTQSLVLFTDSAGELTLHGLAAGILSVTASFGSRQVSGTFEGPGPHTLTMPAK